MVQQTILEVVNIKKLLPVLLLILFLIPSIDVFASEESLIKGQESSTGKTNFTDGDLGTFDLVRVPTVEIFTLDEIQDIKGVFAKTGKNVNNLYPIYATFKNLNGTVIKRIDLGTNKTTNIGVDFKSVKTIEIHQVSAINTHITTELYEFEVYGSNHTINPVTNLTATSINYNSVTLNWVNPVMEEFNSLIIKKDGLEIAQLSSNSISYVVSGLDSETNYNFEVIAEYSDGSFSTPESLSVTTATEPEDITPPGEITSLNIDVSSTGIVATYKFPLDTDFSHLRIYRNNELIEPDYRLNKFIDTNLIPSKSYTYKFVTVDDFGNHSSGYIQTIMTESEFDNTAPLAPTGVYVTEGNGSARAMWNASPENDLLGYYVYINGTRQTSAHILATNFVIPGLTNGQTYTLTITAVDTSGNESEESEGVLFTPDESNMPIFEPSYNLTDVALGTSNWFQALWPIVAFSVGLILAFMVSNRIKELFFA